MAMMRPQGKPLKIAEKVIPGLRYRNDASKPGIWGERSTSVENLYIETNANGGKLPKKYRTKR